jgi:uncharacterized membrane protein YdbT with pleckstrin-like domain
MIFWFVAILMAIPLLIMIIYWYNAESISLVVEDLMLLVGSAYSLFVLGLLIYGFVDYYLDVYILTDKRIVDIRQNGFFKREIAELNLHQVQDVNAEVNGIFPTILHYGNVLIQTAAEKNNFLFGCVPHPYGISKKIIDLHESLIEDNEDNSLGNKKGKKHNKP